MNKYNSDKASWLRPVPEELSKKNITFKENNSILEIGAGSGRICSALLQIEKNLNFKIKFGVEEGIEEMIEFFKNNKEKLQEFNSNLYGNYSINL